MLKWTIILVPILAILVHYFIQQLKPKVHIPGNLNPQYDYIIVGGGTAGCILANRLSEDEKTTVLLLEAGGEETDLFYSHIPGASPLLQNTAFDWQYLTVPQDDCCRSLEDRQVKWPSGKVLGGSSVLHMAVYSRPHKSDFQSWHTSVHANISEKDWSYGDMQQYLRKIENVHIDRLKMGLFAVEHGHSGPVVISENSNFKSSFGQALSEVLFSAGYNYAEDNSQANEGFGMPQFMIDNGRRVSTASAYLRPAMHRTNLHVVARARVNKITFEYNDETKKAVGVEYEYDGTKHRVLTNKEIILSAGAVASPQLLMLSGIGPRKQLEDLEIYVVKDSPQVGQNLRDHVGIVLRYGTSDPKLSQLKQSVDFTSPVSLVKNFLQYFVQGSGILAYPPIEYIGHINAKEQKSPDQAADVQFYLLHIDPFCREFGNLTTFNQDQKLDSNFAFSLGFLLLDPQSSGEVRLQSLDVSTPPLIDPKYFSDEHDLDKLVQVVRSIDSLLSKNDLIRKHQIEIVDRLAECQNDQEQSLLRCLVRERPQTGYHPYGTCKMGLDELDSVVDDQLRVHGVKGLRVVDASVIPGPVSANTCAAVMIVAEKAADLIKMAEND